MTERPEPVVAQTTVMATIAAEANRLQATKSVYG
jgi:hypothetical protein